MATNSEPIPREGSMSVANRPAFSLPNGGRVASSHSHFWTSIESPHGEELRLVSQTWQGHEWRHDITIQHPKHAAKSDWAYLVITGDRVDSVDRPFGQKLADASGLTVATLFQVPNQPLFGKREDDLIAYTFEQYFDTKSEDWPLLKPMVNSAVKAMDAIQEASHGAIKKFIVTGESKRGWATWLVGELQDPRVVGIAPAAFDNLNFLPQLQHQVDLWGHLSEKLGSYSNSPVIKETESDAGHKLLSLIDPFSNLDRLKVPVLAIRGSNDPFWAVDAGELYWPMINVPKGYLVLPNKAHDPGTEPRYIKALAKFVGQCRQPSKLHITAVFSGGKFHCHWATPVSTIKTWAALSNTANFNDSRWAVVNSLKVPEGARRLDVDIEPQEKRFEAIYLEFVTADGTSLTSTIHIMKPATS